MKSSFTLKSARAFTLIELMIVVAVIALLLAILLPSLAAARAQARDVKCRSNQRQLGIALNMYAGENRGSLMPLAYPSEGVPRGDAPVYWWGAISENCVDHTRGFTWPYLQSDLKPEGVYECPEQAWGTYLPQGNETSPTSTYGYNGYYLSSPSAPGWNISPRIHPWLQVEKVREPSRVFAFADTMIDLEGELKNNALLDPPFYYVGNHRWARNESPTTSFRHNERTNAAFVDGHVQPKTIGDGRMTSREFRIGAVGAANDPHYVPDYRDW